MLLGLGWRKHGLTRNIVNDSIVDFVVETMNKHTHKGCFGIRGTLVPGTDQKSADKMCH